MRGDGGDEVLDSSHSRYLVTIEGLEGDGFTAKWWDEPLPPRCEEIATTLGWTTTRLDNALWSFVVNSDYTLEAAAVALGLSKSLESLREFASLSGINPYTIFYRNPVEVNVYY
jgi:hypothetical protein